MNPGHSTMTDLKTQRGRPKGSGIDDRIWLREMERLMRINPALRPTSAIKALGITDQSTIRRLRDKFAARCVDAAASPVPSQRVMAQPAAADAVRRGPRVITSELPLASLRHCEGEPSKEAISALMGLAVQATTLVAQSHALAVLMLARAPAASLVLQQQIAYGEAFAAGLRLQAAIIARAAKR